MAGVVDEIFNALDGQWRNCAQCKAASQSLDTLVAKYGPLKTLLEDVFRTRGVTPTRGPAAHFTAQTNVMTLPHTGKAQDADDIVDGIIFESYNAIRRAEFQNCETLSTTHRPIESGQLKAQVEAETMTDYFHLASGMDEGERTKNMGKCVIKTGQAQGNITAYFLSTPHATDEQIRTLFLHDERRLPSGMMYVYANIQNSTGMDIRAAILTKCNVAFSINSVANRIKVGAFLKVLLITEPPGAVKTAAETLDKLVEKNWPGSAPTPARRPIALLAIIERVQSDAQFAGFRGFLTENAFGFTDRMKEMARQNRQGFTLR